MLLSDCAMAYLQNCASRAQPAAFPHHTIKAGIARLNPLSVTPELN
jgi:hypothetical protein